MSRYASKHEIPPALIKTSHRSPASLRALLPGSALISSSNSRVMFKSRSGSESELCTNPIIFGACSDSFLKNRICTRFPVSESVGKVGGIEPHLTAKATKRTHSCLALFWRVLSINHASTIEIPVNVPGELLIAESIVRCRRESKFHGSRRVISENHWP